MFIPRRYHNAFVELHDGMHIAHQVGPKLCACIRWQGYYWPTMVSDFHDYANKYEECQKHADYIHQAREPLHPTQPSKPFDTWRIDIVGPINPSSCRGHRFILATTDYFTKRVKAIPLTEVKTFSLVAFFQNNIVYRLGVFGQFIHDNGPQFRDRCYHKFCEKTKRKDHTSTTYNLAVNGIVEAFNRTICKNPQEGGRRIRKNGAENS